MKKSFAAVLIGLLVFVCFVSCDNQTTVQGNGTAYYYDDTLFPLEDGFKTCIIQTDEGEFFYTYVGEAMGELIFIADDEEFFSGDDYTFNIFDDNAYDVFNIKTKEYYYMVNGEKVEETRFDKHCRVLVENLSNYTGIIYFFSNGTVYKVENAYKLI